MADREDEEGVTKSGGNGLKIAVIILSVMLVVGGTVAGLFFAGIFGGGGGGDGEAGEEGEETEEVAAGPAVYVPINPAFVVNFQATEKAKFLQVSMEVMTRDPAIPAMIDMHMPAIRNNLMLLFSSQSYEKVSTLEGKEEMREEALSVIQEILEAETGAPGIEAVYFTSIVMQ